MAVTSYGRALEPLDLPEPALPAGCALMEVLTCGVCATDLKTARGQMSFSDPRRLPHVPGHEVFGRVLRTEPAGLVETGTTAIVYQYWSCGICRACHRGNEVMCDDLRGWMGFVDPGGFEERVAVPVDRLIPVPSSVDPLSAAPMSCAVGSAYRAVVTRGRVNAGDRAVVIGLGGVGIHAAQIARAAGADVEGFDLHEETLAAAAELGIPVWRGDDPDLVREVLARGNGEGVDVVIDTVGITSTVERSSQLIRRGGRVVVLGHTPTGSLGVRSSRLVLDEIELVGTRYASRDEMARAVALVVAQRIQPVVGMVRPLEAVNEIFASIDAGQVVGRAVVDVAGAA
jgi:alcohol dehydrogenase